VGTQKPGLIFSDIVGAGSPTISGKNPQSRKPAPTHAKNPKTQYFDGISIFLAGMGRVYEIVDLSQILLVNPRLQVMEIYHIFGWYPPPPHAKNPKTQYFDGISILMAGMGRVFEIVDLYQILLVNPPLQVMEIYPDLWDIADL